MLGPHSFFKSWGVYFSSKPRPFLSALAGLEGPFPSVLLRTPYGRKAEMGQSTLGRFVKSRPSPQGPVFKWDPFLEGSNLDTNLMVSLLRFPLRKRCIVFGLVVEKWRLATWNKDLPKISKKINGTVSQQVFSCFWEKGCGFIINISFQ